MATRVVIALESRLKHVFADNNIILIVMDQSCCHIIIGINHGCVCQNRPSTVHWYRTFLSRMYCSVQCYSNDVKIHLKFVHHLKRNIGYECCSDTAFVTRNVILMGDLNSVSYSTSHHFYVCMKFEPWLNWHESDVIKWKHFPRYWAVVLGIHRSPVNSLH